MLSPKPPALRADTWLPEPRALPAVRAAGPGGKPLRRPSARQADRSLLFFGFTPARTSARPRWRHCAKLCKTRSCRGAAGFAVLFVTVDRERDTPAVCASTCCFQRRLRGRAGDAAAWPRCCRASDAIAAKVPLADAATRWTTPPRCTGWMPRAASSPCSRAPLPRRRLRTTCAAIAPGRAVSMRPDSPGARLRRAAAPAAAASLSRWSAHSPGVAGGPSAGR